MSAPEGARGGHVPAALGTVDPAAMVAVVGVALALATLVVWNEV